MKLIIGLGNPGLKYEKTRHNVGFMTIDKIANELNISFSNKKELQAEIAELNMDGEKLILAKPSTFMNKSGDAVQAIQNKYKISNDDTWIVCDDVTLNLGTLRVRSKGSAGGHNGIKSVIETIGTQEFWRFKIGVGSPEENIPLEDWVLSKFTNEQFELLNSVIDLTKEQILNALQTEPTEESETLN